MFSLIKKVIISIMSTPLISGYCLLLKLFIVIVIFKKGGTYNFLVFCDNIKNKAMINNYGRIIRQIEDEIFSHIDEFKDEDFVFGGDSKKVRFKTDDNLVYNEKNNIPVCVISLSSVIKKE